MTNFPVFAYEMPALRRGCEPAIHRSGHRTSVQLVPDRRPAGRPETWYPLRVLVCTNCWLVQTEDYAQPVSLFNDDYAYFSSYSSSWLRHRGELRRAVVDRFGLGSARMWWRSHRMTAYLLQYVSRRGIPVWGLNRPRAPHCAAAQYRIEVVQDFLRFPGRIAGCAGRSADLTVANKCACPRSSASTISSPDLRVS